MRFSVRILSESNYAFRFTKSRLLFKPAGRLTYRKTNALDPKFRIKPLHNRSISQRQVVRIAFFRMTVTFYIHEH